MSKEPSSSLTARLARLIGVASEYEDAWYQIRRVPIESQEAVLRSMGYHDMAAALRDAEKSPWDRLIEPVIVIPKDGRPSTIPLHFPGTSKETESVSIRFTLTRESGEAVTGHLEDIVPASEKDIDGVRYVQVDLPLDIDLEMGYHSLDVSVIMPGSELDGRSRLIVTPAQCHLPSQKAWGITLSLYSLRSEQDWGIGDLGALRQFMAYAQDELQAGFVGINPLHAIANTGVYDISPYYPLSRIYRNFIYLDMMPVLEASEPGRAFLRDTQNIEEIVRLRELELVDYEGVSALKTRGLRTAWEAFQSNHVQKGTEESLAFENYIAQQGEPLRQFATFMALGDRMGHDARAAQWDDYRDPQGSAVRRFSSEQQDDIRFHQYVQWLIELQLRELSESARGMSIGLYTDLAVGSAPGGSDVWSNPGVFVQGIAVGAPPDAFSTSGQNWGFPPFSPQQLRQTAYEAFIQTIRHNLQHTGALRIDHALGLFRFFWIPKGMGAADGTYVAYPYNDLLGIIALESSRQKAVIIAEDLGTVGDEVRETLHEYGMLSYRLLYFERDRKTGRYLGPSEYPELALAALNTHDLPTIRGFWSLHDIDIREALGLYASDEASRQDRTKRSETLNRIEVALNAALPTADLTTEEGRIDAVAKFLKSTRAALVALSLDDALGLMEQQNLPGVLEGHPNWRRRYPISVERIGGHKILRELSAIFRVSGQDEGKA